MICAVHVVCIFAGFLIMLPVAVFLGELFTFEGQETEGFLAREDLHTAKYMLINLFAGNSCEWVSSLTQSVRATYCTAVVWVCVFMIGGPRGADSSSVPCELLLLSAVD